VLQGEIGMGERVKMVGTFAVLGFLAGLVANATWTYVIPWLSAFVFPTLGLEWIFSGIAGAFITLGLVTAWAYISGPSE
jgi:hypothetical protein